MNPFVIAFRRIIYSIPLKRLLVGLAVFSVLLASFSHAEFTCVPAFVGNYAGVGYNQTISIGVDGNFGVDTWCVVASFGSFDYDIGCNGSYDGVLENQNGKCFNMSDVSGNFCLRSKASSNQVGYYYVDSSCQTQPFTSMQCQTLYNLIPIDSVDQEYCTTNNLCPSYDCPNLGTSNIYINDIFHPGAFNVIMNIPEEIDWDYAYTNSGQNFNVDIVGYNQDFEKIEGWIDTNNYKPSSEDFTNIFTSGFSNFGGLLVAALFVILVFYFVKKLFK